MRKVGPLGPARNPAAGLFISARHGREMLGQPLLPSGLQLLCL